MSEERRLQDFMMIALGRHRHELPANEFDAVIFGKDASLHHRLDLRNREAAARQALGGLRRLRFLR